MPKDFGEGLQYLLGGGGTSLRAVSAVLPTNNYNSRIGAEGHSSSNSIATILAASMKSAVLISNPPYSQCGNLCSTTMWYSYIYIPLRIHSPVSL